MVAGVAEASPSPAATRGAAPLMIVGVVWLALACLAGAADLVVRPSTEPPLRIGLAVGLPVVAVGVALLVSRRFRAWAESLDLSLLINLQGWRVAGFAFLVLYAQGLLPGGFAWPAGVGDLIVGVAAPFVVAVSFGMAHSLTVREVGAAAPMAELPLSLIPTFAVPFLLVVHLLSLVGSVRRHRGRQLWTEIAQRSIMKAPLQGVTHERCRS